ncbi:hypothetical protein HUU05_14360, partial [candidate division KSB1 bacterium]|nr:hypothetical protein [candidate division KSB1 bacterium]
MPLSLLKSSRALVILVSVMIILVLAVFNFGSWFFINRIENSLERNGKVPDVKYTNKQLATTRPKRDAVVYKMHGDVDHASE